jgi:hypothetical protein
MEAVIPLRQATPVNVPFGPFYDRIDGLTVETALVMTAADLKLFRGSAQVSRSIAAAGATHINAGVYSFPLDAVDTAQVGPLLAVVDITGWARPVKQWFNVLPPHAYDALLTAGGVGFPPRDTRDLGPVQHTFRPAYRSVNSVVCQDTLILAPGETLRAGFDCRSRFILPPGAILASQGTPTMVVDNPALTLTALGHDATMPKLEISVAADAPEGSATIMQSVTTSAGSDSIVLYGLVRIVPVSE